MPKLPSAKELVANLYHDNEEAENYICRERVIEMLHIYRLAVLEAVAAELEPDNGWRNESTHHSTVMRTLKGAADVIRKLKEDL